MLRDLAIRTLRSSLTNASLSIILKALTMAQTILFARIFLPAELGALATALLLLSFLLLFSEMKFDQLIVREPDDPQSVMDGAFSLYFGGALASIGLLFLTAPFLASWFQTPELAGYLRFLSFLLLGNMLALPNAMWIRQFRFGISKVPDFADVLVTSLVTLLLYFRFDYGFWSLLWGKLAGFAGRQVTLWSLAPYRPRLQVPPARLTTLVTLGWPLLISSISLYVVRAGDHLLVRYFWGNEPLAYYMLAFSLPYYLKELADVTTAALFPAFSQAQHSARTLREMFVLFNKYLAAVFIPAGTALYVFAAPLIPFIYGDKWTPAIPLLQVIAISFTIDTSVAFSTGWLAVARGKVRYVMKQNLLSMSVLLSVGVLLIYRYGPAGGAYYTIVEAAAVILIQKIPFVYREIGTISYLWGTTKPFVASMAAGLFVHFYVLPLATTAYLFLAALVAFVAIYAAIMLLIDRSISTDLGQLSRALLAGLQRP